MTRNRFIEAVDCGEMSADEIVDFLFENDRSDWLEDIYSEDSMNECINDEITQFEGGWEELRNYLNDIPDNGRSSYYRCTGYLSFEEVEYHTNWLKETALDAMDGYWDDEEEEDEEEYFSIEESNNEQDIEIDVEFDPVGLFSICASQSNVLN